MSFIADIFGWIIGFFDNLFNSILSTLVSWIPTSV
jgi:hypothetical protein